MQRCIWNSGGPDRCTQNSVQNKLYCLFHENEYKRQYTEKINEYNKKINKEINKTILTAMSLIVLIIVAIWFATPFLVRIGTK